MPSMLRNFRILVLLMILFGIAFSMWREKVRIQEWTSTVHVAVFPINADGSAAAQEYINSLNAKSFTPLDNFVQEEARRYGLSLLWPVTVTFGPVMQTLPPPFPTEQSLLNNVAWSLKLRWWSWRNTPEAKIPPTIRLYLLYFDPENLERVPDSVGLERGRIGIIHLYASKRQTSSNHVVTMHELMHTLGATDKYNLFDNQPVFPLGYGEPEKNPRYPQHFAEIMGGRIALSPTQSRIPISLHETLIGPLTAAEIGWYGKGDYGSYLTR